MSWWVVVAAGVAVEVAAACVVGAWLRGRAEGVEVEQ